MISFDDLRTDSKLTHPAHPGHVFSVVNKEGNMIVLSTDTGTVRRFYREEAEPYFDLVNEPVKAKWRPG